MCIWCDLCARGMAGCPKMCFTLTAAPTAQSTYFKVRTSEYLLQNFINLCLWNYVRIWGVWCLAHGQFTRAVKVSWHLPPPWTLNPPLIGFFYLNVGCLMIEKTCECKRQSVLVKVGYIQSGDWWRGRCQSSGGPLFWGPRHKRSFDSFMSSLALGLTKIWTTSTPGISPWPSDNVRHVWLP